MKKFANFLVRKTNTLLNYILLILLLPLSIALFFVIKLIRPIFLIRWHMLMSSRIGHFATDTELYLCEKDFKINTPKTKYLDIFYNAPGPISNKQLDKMWRRILFVMPWHVMKVFDYINKKFSNSKNHEIGNNTNGPKDVHGLLDKSTPHLYFTTEEEDRGMRLLNEMGIRKGQDFICLQVRDSFYLESGQFKKNDFFYHSYRDCDISNFYSVCDYLNSKDIFVVRMGKNVKKKMEINNPKVIDYATNGMRNDFMDIFLGAKCLFWLSTGTGIDNMSKIFRRPILYTNQVPIGHVTTYQSTAIFILKHHYDLRRNKKMGLSEIKEKGLSYPLQSAAFVKQDVKLIENSPEEIKEATKEIYERIKNDNWDFFLDSKSLQEEFWKQYPYKYEFHGNITSKIGSNFLKRNEYLISK